MNETLKQYIEQVNQKLEISLPSPQGPAKRLFSAMRYSVFNGGKRIRPLLCFAAAEAIAKTTQATAVVAASIEMIHAYSLIHDDLPAMDNDNLRRGAPTCHIQYDEATAILAGDALQALAFETLARIEGVSADNTVELLRLLSTLGGCSGMATGQAIDLAGTGNALSLDELTFMHAHKTGALIEASVLMGAVATGQADQTQLAALSNFAQSIGLAFQIQDDILDVESSTLQLGKQQGSDFANRKPTYTSLLGIEEAKKQAADLYSQSIESLEIFSEKAATLRFLGDFIVNRDY
ncbi:MAG: polyprenyl synthetase family protein [Porticoccaceae bacterium]|nr:polyprenyl synthetase family protein [Porticoccaceae bacterium]MDG1474184.1 polyprenyl synthetase family protein [Porticoccaceae bacterium]